MSECAPMPELAGDWLSFISARAVAGLTFGVTVGAFLWLLGLTRRRAAVVIALLLTATYVSAGWGLAALVALQLVLVGVSGRLAPAGERPSAPEAVSLVGIPLLCAIGSLGGFAVAYWLAAGCGAVIGAALAWTVELFHRASVRDDGRPAASTDGMRGPGLSAAIIVVGSLTLATLWLRVLGAGEPALAAVGALLGLGLGRHAAGTRPKRLAAAALIAGVSTALLAALLP